MSAIRSIEAARRHPPPHVQSGLREGVDAVEGSEGSLMSGASAHGEPAVLIVAHEPALRAGLREALSVAGLTIAGESTPRELAITDRTLVAADVVVVDLGGVVDGSERAAALAALGTLPAVLLVDSAPPAGAAEGERAPRGWLRRDASSEELAAAVRAVAAGMIVLDRALAAEPGGRSEAAGDPRYEIAAELTPRETEVLALLALGLTNRAIAAELSISAHTVKFHVGAVLGKLRARSRAEAVAIAAGNGMLTL